MTMILFLRLYGVSAGNINFSHTKLKIINKYFNLAGKKNHDTKTNCSIHIRKCPKMKFKIHFSCNNIKSVKIFKVNLTKEVQVSYTENSKTMLGEIKELLKKWRNIPYSWIGKLTIVKTPVLPNTDTDQ